MIKAVLLAPIYNSLYARLVAFALAAEKDVELSAIIVRSPWSIKRFKSEFNRDGLRLIKKVYQKLLIGDKRYSGFENNNLTALAQKSCLPYKSLRTLALDQDIPYKVYPDHNHPKNVKLLKRLNPDLILFTGGGLLRKSILQIPHLGILNCHTGILPQYRGMDVVEWTVLEEKIDAVGLGVTLHLMDNGVDTGPILIKKKIIPKPGSSFESIRAEMEVMMVQLMIEGVRGLQIGNLISQPQDLHEGRQYYVMHPRIKKAADTRLDLFTEKTYSNDNKSYLNKSFNG